MSGWEIIVPVWGERYINVFTRVALPAIVQAVMRQEHKAKLILYTDKADEPAILAPLQAPTRLTVTTRPVPPGDRAFGSLSKAHNDALARAPSGSWVVLLTADLVMSIESLASVGRHFASGKKLVACAGMRTNEDLTLQPMQGRTLLEWGWANRHRMTRECTWPDGISYDLWRMYFEQDGEVVCRLSLPHPFALVKDNRHLHFKPTIDVNLNNHFVEREIHLATQPEDVAMIEMSPPDKEFLETEPAHKRLAQSLPSLPAFVRITNPRHHFFFKQKIVIKGTGGMCGDEVVVNRLLHGQ